MAAYEGILTLSNMEKIRKAWKNGARRVKVGSVVYTMRSAANRHYILLQGGHVVAQVEKVRGGGMKSTDSEGNSLRSAL
jgi:hypothetical protein